MRIFSSLGAKITCSFIFFVAAISGSSFYLTARSANEAIFSNLQDQLKSVAAASASQISGDAVAKLSIGDEDTPAFKAIRDQLRVMRAENPDLKYSYIMRSTAEGIPAFVVDDSYGFEEDAASIGDAYSSEDVETMADDAEEILSGLNAPTAAGTLYTDRWGTFLSGYAPVRDKSGKAVAVLGVDMSAERTIAKQAFVERSAYLIFVGGMALAALFISLLARSLSRDLKGINDVILGIKTKEQQDSLQKAAKRKDEVGDLARSANELLMEANLRNSLMDGLGKL